MSYAVMARINIPTSHEYVRTAKLNRREASVNGVAVADNGGTQSSWAKIQQFSMLTMTRGLYASLAFCVPRSTCSAVCIRVSKPPCLTYQKHMFHLNFILSTNNGKSRSASIINNVRMQRAHALCFIQHAYVETRFVIRIIAPKHFCDMKAPCLSQRLTRTLALGRILIPTKTVTHRFCHASKCLFVGGLLLPCRLQVTDYSCSAMRFFICVSFLVVVSISIHAHYMCLQHFPYYIFYQ